MKPIKKKDPALTIVIGQLFTIPAILLVFFLILSILMKNVILIVISSFLIIISIFLLFRFFNPIFPMIKYIKRIEKKKKYLIEKKKKTAFEELFIMSCDEQDDIYVNNYLKTIKNKKVKSMKIEPVDENTLLFSCKYSSFDIDLIVTNEEVQLLIDSPSKYDGTKENAELEKKKKKKINQNYNVSKELFIDYLLNIINESADLIDEFIANNNPDLLINGRTINKLSQIRGYMKTNGFGFVILTPPLICLFFVGYFWQLIVF